MKSAIGTFCKKKNLHLNAALLLRFRTHAHIADLGVTARLRRPRSNCTRRSRFVCRRLRLYASSRRRSFGSSASAVRRRRVGRITSPRQASIDDRHFRRASAVRPSARLHGCAGPRPQARRQDMGRRDCVGAGTARLMGTT
jgi:hypothetical protein